jgi:dTDP-4-dehydrorhamnose 3,5-epimerase-like enzyme
VRSESRPLQQRSDARGRVFEVLRPEHVDLPGFGQVYVFTAAPGAVKGNHYHTRKTEWFCVVWGEGVLELYERSTGQRESIVMNDKNPSVVRILPGVAHAMRNAGERDLVVLAYITEPFSAEDPDTFPYEVTRPAPG